MSDTYKILKTVNMFNINTDPYISYWKEWNDVYWYQRTQQKYINTPEGNIEVSTGRKMSFLIITSGSSRINLALLEQFVEQIF